MTRNRHHTQRHHHRQYTEGTWYHMFLLALGDTHLCAELCRLLYYVHQLRPFHVRHVFMHLQIGIRTFRPPPSLS
ncbi:hypothetical protein EGR_10721 [Echinococcus granulosus]|uniref:Uncharacterized protein n=1 Tax=Echinococcus granulosus TaxID=6210 RepID=W6U7R9_ECHGR|nr:hypothetical protein EGR_10721 [Echinococcus granulosus]EUB54422.1 hypothetical protein EGR_10721 [Echinococcus granulosus]